MGFEREKQVIRSRGLQATSGITADTGNITATAGGFKSGAASTFGGKVTLSSGLTVTKLLTCSSAATVTKTLTASSGLSVGRGATILKGGLAISSGAFKVAVANVPTTGTLPNHGFSRLTATTASKNYILAAPAAGAFKVIGAGSTLAVTVTCAAGTYFQASTHADAAPSTAIDVATFQDGTDCLTLMGCSTIRWMVIGNVGTVSLA